MTIASRLAVVAIASLFATGTAFAQTAAPAAKTDAAATTDKKAPKEHSAESLECSKQADAKGLHGKERKKFRSECIKTAKGGAMPAPAPAADKK
jgi:invasion protein IalB